MQVRDAHNKSPTSPPFSFNLTGATKAPTQCVLLEEKHKWPSFKVAHTTKILLAQVIVGRYSYKRLSRDGPG